MPGNHPIPFENNPLWYKDVTIYELHVRGFCDSNGDGIGDFPGLTHKLDYLRDLGVTALWLLPFYQSPLKDDGYDIADYLDVHPMYGTLRDFRHFLDEAHRRGLRVITELVLNHTSDQHAWFQRSRRAAPGSRGRNFYVWSDKPDGYPEARVIFKDFEPSNWSWDPVAKAYFWHRFYSHQPDLNFNSPDVRKAILGVLDFWLGMGVDGMRLDAVPYLFEREGTTCENLSETHAYLKELRSYVDSKYSDRMFLAEANQWPEDASAYFGKGDECHTAFHFPLMPRLFMAIHQEDCFPIVDILRQTPAIPDNCQWALFLRNHDELTLEMVTDEERDYMYRAYAADRHARLNLGIRRRLAPLLGNHRRKIELMNGLLFALPGTPVIYYGDEIGMGDNIYLGDRNGVRTPMQWSPDRNAGFSGVNPQALFQPVVIDPEYHYQTINVEAQQNNLHSMLWWMKRVIALRNRSRTFGRGTLDVLSTNNHKILAFVRKYQQDAILMVANLSRFVQAVEVDLSAFKGVRPVELFSRGEFPQIREAPYFFTLGPHSFYWFALDTIQAEKAIALSETSEARLPVIETPSLSEGISNAKVRESLESILPNYLPQRRWFRSKGHFIRSVKVAEVIALTRSHQQAATCLALAAVSYVGREPEIYALPISVAEGALADQIVKAEPAAVIARLHVSESDQNAVVYDAVFEPSFGRSLLEAIVRRLRWSGGAGRLSGFRTRTLSALYQGIDPAAFPVVLKAEQSNTSLIYQDKLILKLFRRLEEGVNCDLEVGRFLTENIGFQHIPALAGALEYHGMSGEPITVAILQQFVPNQGDAWEYAHAALGHCFERALANPQRPAISQNPLVEMAAHDIEPSARDIVGDFLNAADRLGQRTAELHLALASDSETPNFAPEPFTSQYQRSLYQSMRSLTDKNFALLKEHLDKLPQDVLQDAKKVLDLEPEVDRRFRRVAETQIRIMRIRCHGDYHLGQVLHTGNDFVITDFEGEPARSLSERRLKRCPLLDVAGMTRSFHYAAYNALFGEASVVRRDDVVALEPWAQFWYIWSSVAFLKGYLQRADKAPFLPTDKTQLQLLVDAFMIDKAIYEIGYELDNRPNWLTVPLRGILQLLQDTSTVNPPSS